MHTYKSTLVPRTDFAKSPPKKQQVQFQSNLVPVVLKLKDSYGLWQVYLPHFPKGTRHTLGTKIDEIFLHAIEYSFLASYSELSQKIIFIDKAIARIDLIKLFLLLAWECKSLDTQKYVHISPYLDEVGRMLGAWRKQQLQKTSRQK
jgi:hypothetical protein